MAQLGELAALATSLMFSIAPTLFTLAGQHLGSAVVNRARLLVALLVLMALHQAVYGLALPLAAGREAWWWFGLSGLVGLTLGDAALFEAFLRIGTRLTMLLFSLGPVLSAALAWLVLGETLSPAQLGGMALTVGGVLWVLGEGRPGAAPGAAAGAFRVGLALALLGAAGQAGGLVLAKRGFAEGLPALSGQMIRMLVAALALWAWALARGRAGPTFRRLAERPEALRRLVAGAIAGPVVGVFLSLVAVANAPVGVASTLMSLPPVFLLPISAVVFHEPPSRRAVLGTLVAIAGVALLFLAPAG